MKVIVESTKVHERAGESRSSGKPYRIREQKGLLDGERVRGEISLNLEDDQAPYPAGTYEIDLERSLYIGRWGRVDVRLVLKDSKAPAVSGVSMPRSAAG